MFELVSDEELLEFAKLPTDGIVFFDTETTGIVPGDDEVLSLAICDSEGEHIFCEYFKPARKTEWLRASAVNGIYPEDVADCADIFSRRETIQRIFDDCQSAIGWNVSFDVKMLDGNNTFVGWDNLVNSDTIFFDLMQPYSKCYGQPHKHYGFKSQKLIAAAQHYGYEFDAHDAMEDARATAFVYGKFVADCCQEIDRRLG